MWNPVVQPDTLAEMRDRHSDMVEWPDEQVSKLVEARWLDLSFRLRDLGRAILNESPLLRRLLRR